MASQQSAFKSLTDFDILGNALGKGAFGRVLHVRGLDDFNEYALKEVNLKKVKDKISEDGGPKIAEKLIQLSKEEYQKMQPFNHPNIVRVYGWFEESYKGDDLEQRGNPMYYLVMEFCDGGDLSAAIKEGKPFPEEQIRLWTKQLVTAVKFLHDLNVVHRDIKPKNIFLASNRRTVKLGDFGLSRDIECVSQRESSITRACTREYGAPEFLFYAKPYTVKCDVWSLGVTLYQVANLNLPFPNYGDILAKPPEPFASTYSVELREFVEKMLTKEVDQRPAISQLFTDPFMQAKPPIKPDSSNQSLQPLPVPKNKDKKGKVRGACQAEASNGRGHCRCEQFEWTPGNTDARCEECGHFPYDHVEIGGVSDQQRQDNRRPNQLAAYRQAPQYEDEDEDEGGNSVRLPQQYPRMPNQPQYDPYSMPNYGHRPQAPFPPQPPMPGYDQYGQYYQPYLGQQWPRPPPGGYPMYQQQPYPQAPNQQAPYMQQQPPNSSQAAANTGSQGRSAPAPRVVGKDDESEEAVVIKKKAEEQGASEKSALAQQVKKISTKVIKKGKKSKYDIYQPRMTNEYEQEFALIAGTQGRTGGIRKLSVGSESKLSVKEIVILIVGPTCTGKTTFLNGLANYLFGVQRSDDFRFKIVTPEDESEEGESETRWVSAYVFHDTIHKNFRITVVDTPGFGGTGGMERDKETTKFIGEWFKKTGESGMDHLNGICFVVTNNETRLTPQTVYQISSVTGLFGRDMKENMIPIITFCDGGRPPAITALREQKIDFKKYFPFNNSGIFPVDEDDGFEELFWKLAMKSYEDFCTYLFQAPAVSLNLLTKGILRHREELEAHVMDLKKKLDEEILMLEEMEQHVAIIRWFESEIEGNKNYEITVQVPQIIQEDLPNNQCKTSCIICSYTCHETCGEGNEKDCAAMDSNGYCRNCPKKCHWQKHKSVRFIFKAVLVDKVQSLDELREKYNTAKSGMISAKGMLKQLADKFMTSQQYMHNLIVQIRDAINELKKIAMFDDKMTEVDYIKLLIQSEYEQRSPGFSGRIELLTAQLHLAELIAQVNDPNYDPFAQYKADPTGWMQYLLDTFPHMQTWLHDLDGNRNRQPAKKKPVSFPK